MMYRDMPDVLGLAERESEAVRVFGRWRDRVKAIVLFIGAMVGVPLFAVGYYAVQELQFRYNDNIAFVKISVLGGVAAWLVVFFAAARVARVVIDRRAPDKLAWLAKVYEVPVDKLEEIANMVRTL